MRILIAPNAFKGTFSSLEVAEAMRRGAQKFNDENEAGMSIEVLPIADGGDGTIDAISHSLKLQKERIYVMGANDEVRQAEWLCHADTAILELASACGIAGLKKESLRPLHAHTRGLGMVLKHVLSLEKVRRVFIALGGSASTDGGAGALYEIAVRFYSNTGAEIIPAGGGALSLIKSCDLSTARASSAGREIVLASDVENPLLGPNGAVAVFAPQKGAGAAELKVLEESLGSFASVLEGASGRHCRDLPGAGAAGGTAFGLAAALGANIVSGFHWLTELLHLDEKVKQSDLVISGEGRVDGSSFQGKLIGSLGELCRRYDKPFWIIAGSRAACSALEISDPSVKLLELSSAGEIASAENIAAASYELFRENFPS